MKFIFSYLILFFSLSGMAQPVENQPKLIVGIVVDQMRNDYIFRYNDLYGNVGFKRLMKDGFYGANHHFSYMPTETGPGHASVYTGTTPAIHGIAYNNWYNPNTDEKMYCVQDRSVRTIGVQNSDGQMSPRNLKTTTITDELRKFWNFKSKVIGISLKDRGAVLPAGHLANGAYWLSDGKFISSSFYFDALPVWAKDFNEEDRAQKYIDDGWDTMLPIEKYTASLEDNSPYESKYDGEETPVFPRDLAEFAKTNGGKDLIKGTPFGNSLAFDFATEAIKSEHLGQDDIPDFLALSLSSTDYVGHAYGPRSIEAQDTYLRLDRDLAQFIDMLNAEVGEGNYTLFLTADHGAAEVAQYNIDNNVPGGYLDSDSAIALMDDILTEIDTAGMDLIKEVEGNMLYLDHKKLAAANLKPREVARRLARKFTVMPGVYAAYPTEEIMWGAEGGWPNTHIKRGLYPKLAGDVVFVLNSGWINYGPTGTTHGSPWVYDTHTPLFFYGKGIKPGTTHRETNIRDIAPTLSGLFHIPLPSGATGKAVFEAINK